MGKPAPIDVQHVDQAVPATTTTTTTTPYKAPTPSIALLYSYCTRRDVLFGLLPAIASSLAAGAIAPFMTHVIGQAFGAMAEFTSADDSVARQKLMHKITIVALELIGLSAGSLILSSLTASLWLWVGERLVKRLRQTVFQAVTSREIEWFDMLGQDKGANVSDAESASGAGGLMAKFAR